MMRDDTTMRRCCWLVTVFAALAFACSDDGGAQGDGTTSDAESTAGGSGESSAGSTSTSSSSEGTTASDTSIDDTGPEPVPSSCTMTPPPGAAMPPAPPAYGGGECPPLAPGFNPIVSGGNMRQFLLVAPTDLSADEQLPVVFMWHWLGGDATAFLERGDVQNAVDQMRFLAVIPEAKGDLPQQWPYTIIDGQARLDEELVFFDDLLACVSEAYPVVPHCVASVGVSSGALFTDQLASGRGQYLSSFLSLSGGTGGVIMPWGGSPHIMPALVLWGGPTDACGPLNFQDASLDLEQGLSAAGHVIVECLHNCGHAEPPFDVVPDTSLYAPLWRFVLEHPYWLADGESPWNDAGLPDGMPQWCALGAGNATMREGECGGSQC